MFSGAVRSTLPIVFALPFDLDKSVERVNELNASDNSQGLRELFESLSEDNIITLIEELILLKNESILFIICHIPDKKIELLTKLSWFLDAIHLCADELEIKRFLNKASVALFNLLKTLPFTTRDESLEQVLAIPILKSRNPNAQLAAKCHQNVIFIPPLLLLIGIKAGMNLVNLSKYLSPKQLRFLARFADKEYISDVVNFLYKHDLSAKLYIVLKSSAINARDAFSPDSFTRKEFSDSFNALLKPLKERLEEGLSVVKAIQQSCEKRKSKVGVSAEIPSFYFKISKENEQIHKLTEALNSVNSLTFEACVASFASSSELISHDILTIHKLSHEALAFIEKESSIVSPYYFPLNEINY